MCLEEELILVWWPVSCENFSFLAENTSNSPVHTVNTVTIIVVMVPLEKE